MRRGQSFGTHFFRFPSYVISIRKIDPVVTCSKAGEIFYSPSTPVAETIMSASSKENTSPFARTGTVDTSFTNFMPSRELSFKMENYDEAGAIPGRDESLPIQLRRASSTIFID